MGALDGQHVKTKVNPMQCNDEEVSMQQKVGEHETFSVACIVGCCFFLFFFFETGIYNSCMYR